MTLLDALANHPTLLIACCAALGLLVGSFLNVLILRLPKMLEQSWQAEARELLDQAPSTAPRVSLWSPPSTCPACGARIRAWHNIPVLSWLLLRGRAACCGAAISVQYPLIELAAGLLAFACAWQFGWSTQLAGALILAWALLALAAIDLRTQLLPDNLTLPLLWLGLLFNLGGTFAPLPSAVVGAVIGYSSLWLVFQLFRLLTGKEGIGYGDFKLLAALGAWFGWQALPMLILLSSLVGALVGIGLMVFRRHGREVPIAFGPYIAGAGLLVLLARETVLGLMPG